MVPLLSNGKNNMRKFFVKNENRKQDKIEILGSDVNHIKNVLRLKMGDEIQICNQDTSQNYICEILKIENHLIETKILKEMEAVAEGNIELHIFQGLPKADKMELIIQKGTELGVSKFIPVAFKRCVAKLSPKDEMKKIERWQKIAEVAAKQSHRDKVPQIECQLKVIDICALISTYDFVLLAYEGEMQNSIKKELLQIKSTKQNLKIGVVIGPEGGIEEQEVEVLKQAGAKVVSLGKRILRTETVTLQVSSIIMYELEN